MPDSPPLPRPPDDRLESWKEIAAYLKKGVRTVQRWERTDGLPVRRLGQDRAGLVFAYKSEIDAWWEKQSRTLTVEPEPEPGPAAAPTPPRSPFKWWPIALVLVVATTTVGVWTRRPAQPVPRRALPFTSDHGWESSPSFSPDGRQVVYTARESGSPPQLYVKSLGVDARTRLTAGPGLSPTWSPDGQSIAFLRYNAEAREFGVMLIPSAGGAERQLAAVTAGSDPVWSSDGQWLVAGDGAPKQRSIVAIDVKTGAKHTLAGPVEFGYVGFGLTPDSRRLIYAPGAPGAVPVYEQKLGPGLVPEGHPRQITGRHWIVQMRLAPDGKHILYVDGSWEEGSLRRLRLQAGAQPEVIFATSDRILSPTLSPDGQQLLFAIGRADREEIWRLSLDGEPTAAPFLSSTHAEMNPQYSPDGRTIAFHSTRAGSSDIWLADADGANQRRLTFTNARTTATPRWSPDGGWIVFESTLAGQSEVYIVSSRGGPLRRLTDHPALDAIPRWSRDGRSIYFCSDRTGRFEVWKAPASGGAPVQITQNGGFVAVESVDGQYLYYSQTRNYGPVLRMRVSGGPSEDIIPDIRGLFFAVTARGIYFSSRGAIRFWDAASRQTQSVYAPPKPTGVGLDVSPDGKWLLFTQLMDENSGADLYLMSNLR